MLKSCWTDTTQIPPFENLKGDIKTSVLIIGGGMCGVLCAYLLNQSGIDYVLVEGDRIGQGITKNTTAKITSLHGLIYDKLIKNAGKEKAKMYLESNEKALLKYRELCENMDCDFNEKDAYTYSLSDRKKIEDEVKAANSLGFRAEFIEKLPAIPLCIKGAIKFKNQGQFNPLKFLNEISKGLNIYENTYVKDIKDHTAYTRNGKITANKIIVTTHFPFINTHGSYYLKMYQHRSYVIALEGAPDVDGMYVDESQTGKSFRNYNDLLFVGGGDHRTGKKGGAFTELRDFAKIQYPTSQEKYAWATQDCMSLDGIPYIGHYSKQTPYLYVATGFNKWGMSSSMVAAMILCDMVSGKDNEYKEVYSPSRSILKPQLLLNGFDAVTNLLTPTQRRCTHMGCALKWNAIEHTWDCPCHGSRFTDSGEIIDNPATKDAEVKK